MGQCYPGYVCRGVSMGAHIMTDKREEGVVICRAPYAFVLLLRTDVEVLPCLCLSSSSALDSYSLCSSPLLFCSPWSQLVVIEVKSAEGTKISSIPLKHNDR